MNLALEQHAALMRNRVLGNVVSHTRRRYLARDEQKPVGYSVEQLTKITGVTARQLQWWDEQRILCPPHWRKMRYYTRELAICAGLLARLREFGFMPGRASKMLPKLTKLVESGFNLAIIDHQKGEISGQRDCSYFASVASRSGWIAAIDLQSIRNMFPDRS